MITVAVVTGIITFIALLITSYRDQEPMNVGVSFGAAVIVIIGVYLFSGLVFAAVTENRCARLGWSGAVLTMTGDAYCTRFEKGTSITVLLEDACQIVEGVCE